MNCSRCTHCQKYLKYFDTNSYFILSSYIFPFIYFIHTFTYFPLTPLLSHTCPSPNHLNPSLSSPKHPIVLCYPEVLFPCTPWCVSYSSNPLSPKGALLLTHCNGCILDTGAEAILRQLWEGPGQGVPSSAFLICVSPPTLPDDLCDGSGSSPAG